MKIIAYLHTHWDREWYRTFEEFRFRFFEVFEDIVKKLENGEFSQFYLDGQTILVDDLLEIAPEKKSEIQKLISEKKIIIGPWYTLADEFLVSGEALIRNLLVGTKQAKSYGVEDFLGYLPDAFGHTQGMVDILASFGIKNALLWRGAGDKKSEFVWKSKSDAQITVTHLLEGYFQDLLHVQNFDLLKKTLDKARERNIGDLFLLPIGADHLGACDELPRKIEEFNAQNSDKIEVASVFDYLSHTKQNLEAHTGELRDNSRNFILQGTYSTRNYLKRLNTLTQWELKKIEALAAICAKAKITSSYKNFIDHAWKLLLQNHAHDSICGCSVDKVHTEMELRFEKINQLLTAIKEKTLTKLETQNTLTVFNSSGFDYSGVVSVQTTEKLLPSQGFELVETKIDFPSKIVQNIQQIPISEDLCEIYTYLARIQNAKGLDFTQFEPILDSDLKITPTAVENSLISAKVEQNGTLTIENKKTGEIFCDILTFEDCADTGDTYNFSPLLEDKPLKIKFEKSKIVCEGKSRAILQLKHIAQIPQTSDREGRGAMTKTLKLKTQIILDAQSPILKFKTKFENKSKNHLLQAKFNLPESVTKTFSEDSIGIIERNFDPNYSPQNQPKAPKETELPTNTAPMQRFVWAQGVGILTKGIHEYEVSKNALAVTLLRAVGMLSGKELHTRFNAAGPTIPTKEAQCLRNLTCEYALTFCEKPEELFAAADNYFDPTIAFLGQKPTTTDVNIGNPNVTLLALKEAESQEGLIARILNTSSEPQKTALKGVSVSSDETQSTQSAETIVLTPYELKSVLICPNS